MVIDQILVKVGSEQNAVSLDQWQGMELAGRIDLIQEGGVQFLSGGKHVGTKEALCAIKAAR